MSSGDQKIWRAALALVDGDMVGPHDRCGHQVPLGLVTITSLEQCLSHIEMHSFCYAIFMRVVPLNMNVSDVIALG